VASPHKPGIAAGEPDDMDSLARHAANLPTDLD
jgi:hypothetical protein